MQSQTIKEVLRTFFRLCDQTCEWDVLELMNVLQFAPFIHPSIDVMLLALLFRMFTYINDQNEWIVRKYLKYLLLIFPRIYCTVSDQQINLIIWRMLRVRQTIADKLSGVHPTIYNQISCHWSSKIKILWRFFFLVCKTNKNNKLKL